MVSVKKGMGFKAAQKNIMKKEGVSKASAGAILASAARKASPATKAKNPNLKEVKMPKKRKTIIPKAGKIIHSNE